MQHVDHAQEFVKIARFAPRHEVARGHGHCYRRITMIGHDSSIHTFSVQLPAARHCRREERLTQLFRILNSVLRKRKEARRRNLQFHLPAAIAMAPQLRLVENDSSYVTLQDVYDDYSKSKGRTRETSILTYSDRVVQLSDGPIPKVSARSSTHSIADKQNDQRLLQIKMEVLEEVQAKMDPDTILTNVSRTF
jgi:transformation/transcription domain-associated protein